jgi:ubiquinone/menaquinone biosynthesis C-methylase UbiE
MDAELEQIREQQKDSWNNFSSGWRKWDHLTMDFLRPTGEEIIGLLQPGGTELVLDVAAGTGEPGLTIASMLNGGKVVCVDLAEKMLAVASDNAARRGIENFETRVADVSELPFDDNTFDALSCRFGYMFFPDMLRATREMVRVLKPGGRMAVSVWNVPEKNFWVTAVMGTIKRNIELPAPPAGASGMFRCAGQGLIAGLLTSGFESYFLFLIFRCSELHNPGDQIQRHRLIQGKLNGPFSSFIPGKLGFKGIYSRWSRI